MNILRDEPYTGVWKETPRMSSWPDCGCNADGAGVDAVAGCVVDNPEVAGGVLVGRSPKVVRIHKRESRCYLLPAHTLRAGQVCGGPPRVAPAR